MHRNYYFPEKKWLQREKYSSIVTENVFLYLNRATLEHICFAQHGLTEKGFPCLRNDVSVINLDKEYMIF